MYKRQVKEKAVAHLRRACQARPVHVYTLAAAGTLDARVLHVDAVAAGGSDPSMTAAQRHAWLLRQRHARQRFLLVGNEL